MNRFRHQQEEYRVYRYALARALAWQMRTGKTRAVVESARALHEAMEIEGVLVIAPNGVHRQWAEEQIRRWGGTENNTFTWASTHPDNDKNFNLFMVFTGVRSRLHWFCINMEALILPRAQKAIKIFKKSVGPAMLVIDEGHHFSKAGAKRTSVARGLGRVFEYRRLLSGTLAENSPLQTFSQYEILDRAALGHPVLNSSDKSDCPTCKSGCMGFKNDFCEFGMERRGDRLITTVTGFKNLDKLKQRMAKYTSVVLRSDCEDLPPLQFDHRIVEMTKKQEEWWHTVRDQSLEDIYRLGQERVFDGGAALVKLQQIEGGYWKKKDHIEELVRPEQNPKMLILLDEIMQYDGQVIAWFAFIHEIDAALKFLQSRKIRCGVFHGRARERDRDLAAFRSGDRQVLLAQPQAGGEGRDMSAAGKIVWFSHTPDAVVRNQANERATKMGARQIQIVDMIAPIGKYFLKLTAKKTTLADDVSRYGLRAVLESIK